MRIATLVAPMFSLVTLALVAGAQAQSTAALINEALDKQAELDLDATLPVALSTIQDKTGIPIRATRSVYETLPWGEQTKLTVSIKQRTLREALQAVTQKLGLTMRVSDQEVVLEPVPALVRMGQRAKAQELQLIDTLASTPFKGPREQMTMAELLGAIDQHFVDAKLDYMVENRSDLGDTNLKVFNNQTMLEALEEIHKQTRATWYPWGRSIVVVPKEDQINALLDRPVTIRFAGVDVAQVLTELSRRSGVEFTIQPGAVQRIPPESRTIKLILENVSTRQALETISGFTGLGYVASEKGVYVWNPAAAQGNGRPDRVMTIMEIDGAQVLLPESQIPPDVKQYLQYKREQAIRKLREEMKREGFTPTTQPSNPDL